MIDALWQKKLLNAARRGNAESEELLKQYIPEITTENEARLVERLLAETDQQLFEWLVNPSSSPAVYGALVMRIREHYVRNQ